MAERTRKARILIVDDDPDVWTTCRLALGELEADVHEAPDGLAATAMLGKVLPDVIILDLNMPRMDGFDLCRRVKANVATRRARIIAITGETSRENVARIKQCGARTCLAKPFDMKRLLSEVKAALAAPEEA